MTGFIGYGRSNIMSSELERIAGVIVDALGVRRNVPYRLPSGGGYLTPEAVVVNILTRESDALIESILRLENDS